MINTLFLLAFSQVAGPPVGPPINPPITRSTPVVATSPTEKTPAVAALTVATPAVDSATVRTSGFLEVPERSNVDISAPIQAVLVNLKTEQQDASGNRVLVPLREGMLVAKDQVLGNFDDRELVQALAIAEAQLEVAIAEKNKTIEIEHAELAAKVAEQEVRMFEDANKLSPGAISYSERLKAALAWRQAQAQYELQDYTIKQVRTREAVVREKEVEAAKIRIEQRKLIAPIAGMIVKIEKAEGEWFREGDLVLEILQLDTLRAKCEISTQYDPATLDGKEATIFVKGSDEEYRGRVVFVYPKISHGNIFEVFIEVQNRPNGRSWQLLPGQEISATIHL